MTILRASFLVASLGAALAASADTLYDNLAQTTASTAATTSPGGGYLSGATWQGNRFKTSSSAVALSSVTFAGTGLSGLSLSVYASTGTAPSTLVGALGGGSDLGGNRYSFSGNGIGLTPNTEYWIVATNLSASSQWYYTNGNANAGSTPTTSNAWAYSTNSGSSWSSATGTGAAPYQMSVVANPVPEPSAFAALGLGAAGLLRRRRRA